MIPNFLPRPGRTAALALAAISAVAASASAMQELGTEEALSDPSVASTWLSLPVRVGIFVALLIVTWAFGFYAFFPWVLDRKNAMRPLQAYGLAAGLIWVAWCGSALVVFQDMLIFKSLSMDGNLGEALRNWGFTCAICLAALVGFAMLRIIFSGRSARAAD